MASDSMQNSVRHYENMRDSDVEWIGIVPSDWKLSTIGSVYQARNTKVSDTDYPPLSVTMNGVVPQLAAAAKTDAHDTRKLVKSGDFVINSRSDRRGSCGISFYTGSVSLINTVLEPREKMSAQYYDWLFHTVQFADEFYKNGHGIVDDLWTTGWQEMKRIIIPMPSLYIQEEIAAFLNKKCEQIDSAISQAKTSIEEYKAWKASIIYEAVTQGLDPSVEMKDSGVAWIGKIPNHWNATKIGNFVSIRSGITLGKRYTSEKALIARPYLRVANVKADRLALDDVATIMVTPEEAKKYELVPGELLMTEGGDRDKLGRGTIWNGEIPGCLHQNHVFAVHVNEKYMLTKYLDYLTTSPVGREYFDLTAKKTTNLASTNSSTILRFTVPVPPISEQRDIVAMLDTKCKILDEIIQEKEALVRDLDAYKKSLIYEVVTGKRKIC